MSPAPTTLPSSSMLACPDNRIHRPPRIEAPWENEMLCSHGTPKLNSFFSTCRTPLATFSFFQQGAGKAPPRVVAVGRPSSVNDECGPGQKIGFTGRKERDGRGHFLDMPQAANGRAGKQRPV